MVAADRNSRRCRSASLDAAVPPVCVELAAQFIRVTDLLLVNIFKNRGRKPRLGMKN